MSKGLLAGLGVALAVCTIGATDASACSRWNRGCDGYYAPSGAYGYGPPSGYGYVPPAPVYGWGPPPNAYYYAPPPRYGYGYTGASYDYYGYNGHGYRGRRSCDRGYLPPVGYGYRPTGYWVPVR